MTTLERVAEVIGDCLGVEEDDITLETSLIDDFGADGLDLEEITMALEDEFGIEILTDDPEVTTQVKDLVEYIERRTQK